MLLIMIIMARTASRLEFGIAVIEQVSLPVGDIRIILYSLQSLITLNGSLIHKSLISRKTVLDSTYTINHMK